MAYKRIWTPRTYSQAATSYGTLDKPTSSTDMFYSHQSKTYTRRWTDYATGKEVNFGNTVSSGDNRAGNLGRIWLSNVDDYDRDDICQINALVKIENYVSVHWGAIPNLHSLSSIRDFNQHSLPGYVGLRFQYRWGPGNHWSDCPVHMNDVMFHYYNQDRDRIQSYEAVKKYCSTSTAGLQPDNWVSGYDRKNGSNGLTWRGATYAPSSSTAINQIKNDQLHLIGWSVEFKYSKEGGASHTRNMQFRNLTPLRDPTSGANYRPVLTQKTSSPWNSGSRRQFYLVS